MSTLAGFVAVAVVLTTVMVMTRDNGVAATKYKVLFQVILSVFSVVAHCSVWHWLSARATTMKFDSETKKAVTGLHALVGTAGLIMFSVAIYHQMWDTYVVRQLWAQHDFVGLNTSQVIWPCSTIDKCVCTDASPSLNPCDSYARQPIVIDCAGDSMCCARHNAYDCDYGVSNAWCNTRAGNCSFLSAVYAYAPLDDNKNNNNVIVSRQCGTDDTECVDNFKAANIPHMDVTSNAYQDPLDHNNLVFDAPSYTFSALFLFSCSLLFLFLGYLYVFVFIVDMIIHAIPAMFESVRARTQAAGHCTARNARLLAFWFVDMKSKFVWLLMTVVHGQKNKKKVSQDDGAVIIVQVSNV